MEGQICRWCHEGDYEFKPSDDCTCHIRAPCVRCEETELACTSCGEAPMTFEEAEKERGRQIAATASAHEAQPGGRGRLAKSQRSRLAFGRQLAVRSRHARAVA